MSETILGHLPAVRFEGESSESSYSYRYYDANRIILGMPLREHPRFAVAHWHSFVGHWHASLSALPEGIHVAAAGRSIFRGDTCQRNSSYVQSWAGKDDFLVGFL